MKTHALLRWVKVSSLWAAAAMVGACATTSDKTLAQARAHTELAARYYEVGQVAVAVQEAQIALKSDNAYVPAHTLLALIYAQLQQNAQADTHFRQALTLSEVQKLSTTDLRNSYAWYLCQTERVNEGLSELSQVLRDPLYGSMDKALVNATVCAARAGQMDQADAYVNAALAMRPDLGVAYLYRGHLAVRKAQFQAARNDWNSAQKLLGETPETLWLLAQIERNEPAVRGVRSNGSGAAERLLHSYPVSPQANWLRAGQWQWF